MRTLIFVFLLCCPTLAFGQEPQSRLFGLPSSQHVDSLFGLSFQTRTRSTISLVETSSNFAVSRPMVLAREPQPPVKLNQLAEKQSSELSLVVSNASVVCVDGKCQIQAPNRIFVRRRR
jgi:hypothetical protein